jgi:hypothetical protein
MPKRGLNIKLKGKRPNVRPRSKWKKQVRSPRRKVNMVGGLRKQAVGRGREMQRLGCRFFSGAARS